MRRFRRPLQAICLFLVLVIGIPFILLWADFAGGTSDCTFELSFRFPGCLISHQKELAGTLIGAWGTVLAGWLAWVGVQGQLAAQKKEDIRKRINLFGDEQVAFDRFIAVALKLCVLIERWDKNPGIGDDANYRSYYRALHDAFVEAHEFRNIASAIDRAIYSKQAAGYSALQFDFLQRSELKGAYDRFERAHRSAIEKRGEIIRRLNRDLSHLL